MNILISGVNPLPCGHKPKMGYVSSVIGLEQCLLDAGHTVDRRAVVLGEDLQQYDRVYVFLQAMRGFLAINTLSALWAIHAAGSRCVISFDDWQVREALFAIRAFAAEREKIVEKNPFGYRQIENFAKFKTELWQALDRLVETKWTWPVLVPAYRGGNLSLLSIPEAPLFTYNPSVLFKGVYGYEQAYGPKEKKWVLAALHNHVSWLKKQKLSWPVNQFGHRKQGQPRLIERDIYAQYVQSAGALSPAYKIAGSGWWRARYGFSADALSVIAGSPEEVSMINTTCYPDPATVEKMSDAELERTAEAQRTAYYDAAGTEESVLRDILAATV